MTETRDAESRMRIAQSQGQARGAEGLFSARGARSRSEARLSASARLDKSC